LEEKLEDTEGVMRCRKSTKDPGCNGQYKYEYNQQTKLIDIPMPYYSYSYLKCESNIFPQKIIRRFSWVRLFNY